MIITIISVVSKTSNAAAAGVELLRPLSRHSVHRSVKRLSPELIQPKVAQVSYQSCMGS